MGASCLHVLASAGSVALGVGLAALLLATIVALLAGRAARTRVGSARTDQERSAAVAAAARSERAELDTVLGALDDGIALFGPGGDLVYRNPSTARLLRRTMGSAGELSPEELRLLVEQAMQGEHQAAIDVSPGGGFVLRAVAIPLPDGQVLLALEDVTRARRLDAVRREFVANASHELKTPVASIQALAETIEDASVKDPGSIPRFAQQLRGETHRLARIISDLLDLSRLEGGPVDRAAVRLDRLAMEEIDRFAERARGTGLELEMSSAEPLVVAGSERDLRQLVRNLVENALQYTAPGGRVEVAAGAEDGTAVLRVTDTGIGIPSRDRDRVFERFYRVDRARSRDTGGTGLGLSIVKHVAENHGGSVTVDSELGRGSTFTVRLPLSEKAR